MQQPGIVHGGYRMRELETDADRFDRTDLSLLEDVLEGIAANELHPEADLTGNLLGAVDGDDVRIPYPGEQSALVIIADAVRSPAEQSAGRSFNATSRSSRVSHAR